MPPRTVVDGRIRADAKLYHLPDASQTKPGRKPRYGQLAPTPEELRCDEDVPWQPVEAFAAGKTHAFKIKTLGPLRWRPAGQEHNLRLIVIAPLGYRLAKDARILYRKPAFLICTDPSAPLDKILLAYLWRWDIEVNFRDEKTILGVGQAQVRHQPSVQNVPALAVAAYAMLLTAAIQAYGPTAHPGLLPAPKWRSKEPRRPSTQSLVNHLRHELWDQAIRFSGFTTPNPNNAKPHKGQPSIKGALFYSTA